MTDQITIPRALLEQALESLWQMTKKFNFERPHESRLSDSNVRVSAHDAMNAIRAELAKPVEPVEPAAWRTFDGEGGYMFRAYEDNEVYKEWWEKRNPHHKGWVEPLYDQAAIDAAVAAERERCAKVCDAIAHDWRGANSQSVQCANAIREGE